MKRKKIIIGSVIVTLSVALSLLWIAYDKAQNPTYVYKPITSTYQDFYNDYHSELNFFMVWAKEEGLNPSLELAYKRNLFGHESEASRILMNLEDAKQSPENVLYPLTLEMDGYSYLDSTLVPDEEAKLLLSKKFSVEINPYATRFLANNTKINLALTIWIDYSVYLDPSAENGDQVFTFFSLEFQSGPKFGRTGNAAVKMTKDEIDDTALASYMNSFESQLSDLFIEMGCSLSLSNQLQSNAGNFYQGYREFSGGEYRFERESTTEIVDGQWLIQQTFTSPDTRVTFIYNKNRDVLEVSIERDPSSDSVDELFQVIEVIVFNKLDYWPFPQDYWDIIRYNFTEVKEAWALDLDNSVSIECSEYLSRYRITWNSVSK